MSSSFSQEDIRDLINDSSISNISIIGRAHNGGSPAVNSGPNPRRKRGANTPKMAAAASPASGGPRRGLKESLSQISLRTQRSLRSSMKRAAPPSATAEPSLDEAAKRVKVGRIEPMDGVTEAPQNGGSEVNGESQGKLKNVLLKYFFCCVIRVSDPDPDPYWIRIQSGQWIRIRIRIRNPDPYSESGSGSRRAKMTHKSRKIFFKVHVLKCWMASFES